MLYEIHMLSPDCLMAVFTLFLKSDDAEVEADDDFFCRCCTAGFSFLVRVDWGGVRVHTMGSLADLSDRGGLIEPH